MKKIIIGIFAVLILLFGGLTLFVNTKSDFIIEKVSEILEKNLNAKLEMEKLPKISIFPSLKVSVDKASLTSPGFTVTFNSADVNVALFKLLSGTVHINSVKLDTLMLKYTAPKQTAAAQKTETKSETEKEEAKSLEEIFALIPAEISVTNSNVFYKDDTQEINLQNINAKIKDFGLNQNSSVSVDGNFAYKDKAQDIAFDLTADINFLFMGQHLEYDIKKFNFTPTKGFPFTQPVAVTAESAMNFSPIIIEKLDGTIKSPFAELNLKSKGDKQKGELTVDGSIFPLAIQESFLADMTFNNLPKSMKVEANISNSADEISINNLSVHPHDGLISLKGKYQLTKQELTATLFAEKLAIQDYLPKADKKKISAKQSAETKAAAQKQQANKQQGNSNFRFNLVADAEKISYDKFVLDTLHSVIIGKITNTETIIEIQPLTLTKSDEPIHINTKLELQPKDLVTVNVDAPSITAKNWASAFINQNAVDAKLAVHSNLNLKTADPLNTLNGNGQIDGSAITIETKLLPFVANLLQLNLKLEDRYQFSTLKAPFTIKNGLLSTPNSYVDSPVIYAGTNGTTHLGKQSLNLQGNVELKKQHMTFPYRVGGTYSNPQVGLDLTKQLEILGGGLLNTGKAAGQGVIDGEKLIEKGLGKLFKK